MIKHRKVVIMEKKMIAYKSRRLRRILSFVLSISMLFCLIACTDAPTNVAISEKVEI